MRQNAESTSHEEALVAPSRWGGFPEPAERSVRFRDSLLPALTRPWDAVIPLNRQLPRGVRAGIRIGMLLLLAGTAVYVLRTLRGPEAPAPLFDDWLYNFLLLVAAAACGFRAARVSADRAAWWLLTLGVLGWALGDIYWTLFLGDLESPPYPSPADALYLSFYLLGYAALALFVRDSVARFHRSMYLDGLIGALAVAGLAAALVIEPILRDAGGSPAEVITNIAYPIGDLLFLIIVVGVFALTGWRPPRAWLLLGVGFATFAVADSAFLYRVSAGTYEVGTILDSLWLVGIAALAFAAWQSPSRAGALRLEGWPLLVPPMLFTLAALGLLVLGNFRDVSTIGLGLALASLVAVLGRVALSFREIRALPETRRQAQTDELTGLPNRRFFYEQLRSAIARAQRRASSLAVLLIDLDRFKELNDTLGHYAGDTLLRQLGPRFQRVIRAHESVARLGGDEFALLLTDASAAEAVAERIAAALEDSFVVEGVTVQIEASIGIALFPEHAADADGLLQRADVAMYQAKSEGARHRIYAKERDQHSPERLSLVGELRHAIDAGQLVLHYQPKSELRTGAVIGVEALVRWQHPERGLVPPNEFIPLAEQTGVMRPLTLHLLASALRQARAWLDAGRDLSVAVNISATNVLDDQFPGDVGCLLAEHGVPPQRLQLEITEGVVMNDPVRATDLLNALRSRGVEISLDDFGTGFSSLAYLKQLPVDELKIDRSFVMSMASDESDAAIVRSIVDLGRGLGLRVVAEGVEDEHSLRLLAALGCDLMQGYHLSRPLPVEELDAWLDARAAAKAGHPALATR